MSARVSPLFGAVLSLVPRRRRAHLLAVIVNPSVRGGWLEFLGHVTLDSSGFDGSAERGRVNDSAEELTRRQAALEKLEDAEALVPAAPSLCARLMRCCRTQSSSAITHPTQEQGFELNPLHATDDRLAELCAAHSAARQEGARNK